MADQNKCRNLDIQDKHSELLSPVGIVNSIEHSDLLPLPDTLGKLFELQKSIQEDVYKYDFRDMQNSMSKMSSFFLMNYEAIQDELREFREAMGGMDSYGSALWKPWKKGHMEANHRSLHDLTEAERVELKMEWVDMLHFLINMGLMIGLTSKEAFNMYHAKNLENIERQKRGY